MSDFTFLHAADLHLASPLSGLAAKNAELAARFAAASREAFTGLVTHAIDTRAAFLLIAGDVFDGNWPDLSIGLFFARELSRLDRAGIPVAIVRGNHDAKSVVTKSVSHPPLVHEFPVDRATTHRLDHLRVAIHGRSFPDRAVPDASFAGSYPEPRPGWFNIGLLHTSCDGSSQGLHDTYAPCSPIALAAKGYDYWALGHVHDYVEVMREPPIIFPGNLQGRSVRECGPKGAVAVDVADGRVTAIRRLVLDRARFAHLDVALDYDHEDEASVLSAVAAALRPQIAEAEGRPLAVRVTLRGETPLHGALAGDPERLAAEIQAAAHRLHEDVWLEALKIRTVRPARPAPAGDGLIDPAALLAELDHDPQLRRRAAEMIAEIAKRLPGGMGEADEPDLAGDLDQLCLEAEAMIMTRLAGRGC